jgi:hypothetical protein
MGPDEDAPDPAGMAEEAAEFTPVSEEYRRYIQAGLDEAARGETIPWEVVRERWRAIVNDPKP